MSRMYLQLTNLLTKLATNFYVVSIVFLTLLAFLCGVCGAEAKTKPITRSTMSTMSAMSVMPSTSGPHMSVDLGTARDVLSWTRYRALPKLHISHKGGR
jgi:hypothetical protein